MFVLILIILTLFGESFSLPSTWMNRFVLDRPETEVEYEKCFYQSDNWKTFNQVIYGQCMNANGPDGCCLEGFYKPGICPNLGHLCCIKPDPDCSNLRNNKGMFQIY